MPKKISGESAIVTGGSSGIGKAIANALLSQKINVAVISKTSSLPSLVRDGEGMITTHTADLRDSNQTKSAFNDIKVTHENVKHLIACAGVAYEGPFLNLSDNEFHEMIDTNIKGLYYSVKEWMRHFLPSRGHIVLLASANALEPVPNLAVYAATKSWIRSFGLSIQGEVAEHGISVTIVNPSLTNTKMAQRSSSRVLPEEMIQPSEVAETVLFALKERGAGVIQEINIFRRNKWQL